MGSCKITLQLSGCLSTLSSPWLWFWPRSQDNLNSSDKRNSFSSSLDSFSSSLVSFSSSQDSFSSSLDSFSSSQDSFSSSQDSFSSSQDNFSSNQDSFHRNKVPHPSKLWTDSATPLLSNKLNNKFHPDQKFSSILRLTMDNVERIMVGSPWSC